MRSTQPLVYPTQAERWSPMELCLQGPSQGNPFMEQSVTAVFRCSNEEVTVSGFYDGDGVYRVRFMPSFQGTYSFTVTSTFSQPLEGTFQVTPATGQNHGMVRVANTWHPYDDAHPITPWAPLAMCGPGRIRHHCTDAGNPQKQRLQ